MDDILPTSMPCGCHITTCRVVKVGMKSARERLSILGNPVRGNRQDLLLSEQTPPLTFDFALTNTASTSLLAFFFPQKQASSLMQLQTLSYILRTTQRKMAHLSSNDRTIAGW